MLAALSKQVTEEHPEHLTVEILKLVTLLAREISSFIVLQPRCCPKRSRESVCIKSMGPSSALMLALLHFDLKDNCCSQRL